MKTFLVVALISFSQANFLSLENSLVKSDFMDCGGEQAKVVDLQWSQYPVHINEHVNLEISLKSEGDFYWNNLLIQLYEQGEKVAEMNVPTYQQCKGICNLTRVVNVPKNTKPTLYQITYIGQNNESKKVWCGLTNLNVVGSQTLEDWIL